MEVEDDVFFQELSRRISLLIMDDDDEAPVASCPSVSLQDFSGKIHPNAQSPYLYEQTTCISRESKGTGVFIPQSSRWRNKNRYGRFTSSNTKSHKQQPENTRGVVSHVPYSTISNPPSFNNPRK